MSEELDLAPSPTASARLLLPDPSKPRIVIVGAGFGGLECAKALARTDAEIVLVDRENHHCFQPLLYQVATAALAPNDVAWPIRTIVRKQANVATLMAEITGVDTRRGRVCCDAGDLPFDFLVLSTGATHSYFGHDEWAEFAPGLKRIEDALTIRRRVLLSFERAEVEADEARQRRLLNFVVVGGGPTGVELAGAIAEMAHKTLVKDFRRVDPKRARILLIEAGDRILPGYPPKLSAYAERALRRKGVEVRTGVEVTDCTEEGVGTADGAIAAANVIWAAGVEASPAARWTGAPADKRGRVKVDPALAVPGMPNVFVIGDAATVRQEDGEPVPGIAPAAKQMGRYVARVIAARLGGAPAPAPFRYRHSGDLATVGRNDAVVRLRGLSLTGFPGWAFWSAAHIFFLIGARNRIAVAFSWLWDYVTFQRSVRLIT